MDSIPASQILFAAAALAGEVVAPETGEFAPNADILTRFTARLNVHLPEVWQSARWPEVTDTKLWRLYDARYWTTSLRMKREDLVIDPSGCGLYIGLATAVAQPGDNPWPLIPLSDTTHWFRLRDHYGCTPDWLPSTRYTRGDLVRFQKADAAGKYSVGLFVCSGSPPPGEEPPLPITPGIDLASTYWTRVDSRPLRFQPPEGVGEVLAVSASEPDGTECPEEFSWDKRGIRVGNLRAENWFTYRVKTPLLFGAPWQDESSYVVGDQVWFMAGQSGDFYNVADSAPAAGTIPTDSVLQFQRVEIPRRFAQWLIAKIAGDWLRWTGNDDKAHLRDIEAAGAWDRMHLQWERDQKQQRPFRVRR